MILIVASSADQHVIGVAQTLARMNAPFRLVDSSQLSTAGRIEFFAGRENDSAWTCSDGRRVVLSEVTTVWHRRRYLPPLPVLPNPKDMAFIEREWREYLSGVFSSLDAFFVNDPIRQEIAVKPLQLRLAQELGLRIPDTVITNDPAVVAAFVDKHHHQVIHKTLSSSRHRFLGTTKWKPSDVRLLQEMVLVPTIFQEVVTDCRELRVTVVGEDVFAAEFRPPNGLIDGRLDLDVPYLPHVLPSQLQSQLLALVRRLGLVYSTIDLKLTNDGEYVFLELNPQGQFLYVEILSAMPITAAVASLLVRGAQRFPAGYEGKLA